LLQISFVDKVFAMALMNESSNPQLSRIIYDKMMERVTTHVRHIKELKLKVKGRDRLERLSRMNLK